MVKIKGDDFFFPIITPPEITEHMARLLRQIYYEQQISNDEFVTRARRFLKKTDPGLDPMRYNQKIAVDRKFFLGDQITDKMFIRAMGYIGFDNVVLENKDNDNIVARARRTDLKQTVFFTL